MIGLALDAGTATAAIQSDGGDFIFGPEYAHARRRIQGMAVRRPGPVGIASRHRGVNAGGGGASRHHS